MAAALNPESNPQMGPELVDLDNMKFLPETRTGLKVI
jgi:hypothetical protein